MASPLSIVFVCTGNICRSPMGEYILKKAVQEEGLECNVTITSCGTGGWHVGDTADHRALAELQRSGYDGSAHRAAQLSAEDLNADLLLALDAGHKRALLNAGCDPAKVRLVRSFDPASQGRELDVADPYYGDESGFVTTRTQIEASVPGIIDWIHDHTH